MLIKPLVESPGFASNIRRLLQVRSATHYKTGFKSGKLASSQLYRCGMPLINGGEWNSKIFRRKTSESDVLNAAGSLVVDFSGSMRGANKVEHAASAAMLLNHAFSTTLRIPVEVLTFTHSGAHNVFGIMKSFNRPCSSERMADRFNRFISEVGMLGNGDADALLFAYNRLLARKEKKKFMIVLSDGCPADIKSGDPATALRETVKAIEKDGLIKLFAIGILTEQVKHFYSKYRIINRAEQVEQAVLELAAEAI